MAEKEPPYFHIHPMRVLFMIGTNPPPTFSKPAERSQEVIDFLAACLVKDPSQRPSAKQLLKVTDVVQGLINCSTRLYRRNWQLKQLLIWWKKHNSELKKLEALNWRWRKGLIGNELRLEIYRDRYNLFEDYSSLQLTADSYESYNSDGDVSDSNDSYESLSPRETKNLKAAATQIKAAEAEGSADYNSLFASVKQKYLQTSDTPALPAEYRDGTRD